MIFSKRRKSGRAAVRGGETAVVWVKSHDAEFAAKLEALLREWGCTVCPRDRHLAAERARGCDVVLLDIREAGPEAYHEALTVRQGNPGAEMVLINRPDNVAASIAGMRAGAGGELILPFDTNELKRAVAEACKRTRSGWYNSLVKPIMAQFSESMMAATFAQAGDFDGALDLLDASQPRPAGKRSADNDRG